MTTSSDPTWEQMFDIQYEVSAVLDTLIVEAMPSNRFPPIWRATLKYYLIEHLAEGVRMDMDLPPINQLTESNPTESEQSTND